ncbi:YceI family protein [Dokdonia sinensis]|uniref:YceI family protein n=1 Tax=Dokdonia sinensis TaxID=2479847 RepID=A0A3M0GEM8_9FLAO|nr:YceI family protein [Dokdonia sinensis]RMB62748.1 YceI family protein [Dokdonia sinensis]
MERILLFFLLISSVCFGQNGEQYFARQGQMTFFSYTSVENIKAQNDQVQSVVDTNTGEIIVSILIKAFKFEKSLMEEHFNESYMESDLFPKATFQGNIIDFDPSTLGIQTRIIKGDFTLRGVTKPVDFKVNINNLGDTFSLEGDIEVLVKDYNIKIPALLSPNIANAIQVKFNLEYKPYEK